MERSIKKLWPAILVLCAFVAAGLLYFVVHAEVDGDDLSSSYVGCRVVAAGQASHLYAHDPKNFAAIGPDVPWEHAAEAGGYQAFLHPYVQTPLWAYALLPVCRHTTWLQFEWLFAVLALISFGAVILLVARFWAPIFLHPLVMVGLVVLLWFFEPFQYSMTLMQTHVFFLLAMIAAVILAGRNHPVSAGLLLALATTVKITPGILVVYWLTRRQWKPAIATAGWLGVLWLVTRSIAGPDLMATYSATIERISHTLLLSFNNQSFAAWWMDHFRSKPRQSFEPLPLPEALRLACSALLALTAIAGGWMDTNSGRRPLQNASAHSSVPVGALITMIGATTFAPIEWTHYSIVLIAPLMVLVQSVWQRKSPWLLLAVVAILALNFPPLAVDPYAETLPRFAILRGHLFSEIVCLVALFVIVLRRNCSTEIESRRGYRSHP